MSPFMSSMPAAGLIEMPPVSKHTPLPTKATGLSPFLPPFQRMTTSGRHARALRDAEQRAHAELGICAGVSPPPGATTSSVESFRPVKPAALIARAICPPQR
jgi:hypothetical protein